MELETKFKNSNKFIQDNQGRTTLGRHTTLFSSKEGE